VLILEVFHGKKLGMLKKLKYILFFTCVFVYFNTEYVFAGLSGRIDKIISSKNLSSVEFGIVVVEADSEMVVYSHNSRKALTPASNMKLLTSWVGLKNLGADYKFETKVGLYGDKLAIIGGGDPLLGEAEIDKKHGRAEGWVFEGIINALESKDVNEVNGIIIDSSIFDDVRVNPSWPREQLNRSYACEISGLNYNGNCVKIGARKVRDSVELSIEPSTSYVKLINKVESRGKNAIGSYRNSQMNVLTVFGRCSSAASFEVAIERPAAFFGFCLAERLQSAGIAANGQLSEEAVDQSEVEILTKFETPIEDVLRRCNKDSFGLAAESLYKIIGARLITGGSGGSWPGGALAVSGYLQGIGISGDEYFLDDGSGLSVKNKLSANLISQTILDARQSPYWPVFKDSLAVGGLDGTISRYFREGKYKGKVFAKSGYIQGVRALSGVCTKGSKEYVFSILANKANGKTKAAIHDIVESIIDY